MKHLLDLLVIFAGYVCIRTFIALFMYCVVEVLDWAFSTEEDAK